VSNLVIEPSLTSIELGLYAIKIAPPNTPHKFEMDQLLAEIRKIPPVTRIICGSSLGVTGSVLLGAVAPYTVLFVKDFVFKKLQVCPFLIFEFILS